MDKKTTKELIALLSTQVSVEASYLSSTAVSMIGNHPFYPDYILAKVDLLTKKCEEIRRLVALECLVGVLKEGGWSQELFQQEVAQDFPQLATVLPFRRNDEA